MIRTEDPDFIRDESSHALINTNVNAFKLYKQQREARSIQEKQEQEIANLRDEVAFMKQLLQELVREKNV